MQVVNCSKWCYHHYNVHMYNYGVEYLVDIPQVNVCKECLFKYSAPYIVSIV